MSKPKYTPGPWVFGSSEGQILFKKSGRAFGLLAQICTDDQSDGTGDYSLSDTEVVATACLITAAPDLLEAAKTLLANSKLGKGPSNKTKVFCELQDIQALEAAVSKAEGRDK